MKNLILVVFVALISFACNEGSEKKKKYVSESSGKINNLTVVVDNILWENNVGEAIRNVLASPLEGLPQEEPIFSLSQMPPQVFSGFAAKNRTVLKIEKGNFGATSIMDDIYARPQTVVVVSGQTNDEIIDQLNTNAEKIVDAFKKTEINEQQRRISLSLFDDSPLTNKLGVSLDFPSAYRIAIEEDRFFWIRKDIRTGTMDLLIYQVSHETIRKGDSAVSDIVKLRDSIGKQYIQGRLEGAYMGTEDAYAPYFFETVIDNKPTFETKGIWDVKNDFMAGPFINYAIEDELNKRYIVIEGYVFAPSVEKRDYIFELESIIRSAKIK